MDDISAPTDPIDLRGGPARLGRHVLLAKLGRGGMSVVYAAYDEDLDRKVAIKILHSGGPLQRARLRREAQALAQLTHPNVVRIYEIRAHEQLDYIVMELVEGVTLARWSRAPSRTPADILAVYIAAGRGLAAAHAKGIVHRDFKPDNAMVRSDGQVLVMDFGLARDDRVDDEDELESDGDTPMLNVDEPEPRTPSTSRRSSRRGSQLLTRVGAIMGTVGYMAPEQVRGQIADARSDQFSFCVSLWEALHGELPFGARDLASYRERLLSGQPPTTTEAPVPVWLRTVLERGLAIEAPERWPSMNALLDALEHDPTRGRRRMIVGAAAVALITAIASLGWHVDQRTQARQLDACTALGREIESSWNQEVAVELEHGFATTQHTMAASAWAATRPWLDDYAEQLAALRQQNCVATNIEQTRSEPAAAQVSACLDDGQASFEALLDVLREADASMIHHAAKAASRLPLLSDCTDARRQAAVLRPPAELQGQLRTLQGRLFRAQALYQIGERERALGEAEAALVEAEALGWAPAIGGALLILAPAYKQRDQAEAAEQAAERAFRKLAVAGDSLGMAEAAVTLATIASERTRLDEAEAWCETAEDLIRSAKLESSSIASALARAEARNAMLRGYFDEAIAQAERGLALLEQLYGPEHPGILPGLEQLANIYTEHQDYAQALAIDERLLAISERAYGSDNINQIALYSAMGGVLNELGKRDAARHYYERGLALAERAHGPQHSLVGSVRFNLGLLLYDLGDLDGAREHFEASLPILEAVYGSQNSVLIKPLVNLGLVDSRFGEHERALAYLRRALALLESVSENQADPRAVWLRACYADALMRAGTLDEAHREYEQSLLAAEQAHGVDAKEVIRPLLGLAEIEIEREDLPRAEARLERAQALIGKDAQEQQVRAWELEFVRAQLRWARGEDAGLDAIHQLQAQCAAKRGDCAEIGEYAQGEIDVWLTRHGLAAPK